MKKLRIEKSLENKTKATSFFTIYKNMEVCSLFFDVSKILNFTNWLYETLRILFHQEILAYHHIFHFLQPETLNEKEHCDSFTDHCE